MPTARNVVGEDPIEMLYERGVTDGLPAVPAGSLAGAGAALAWPSWSGGSLGFADLQAKVGFGYTLNQMGPTILIDPRATALINAVYASL
jgi:hypothetical protein